MNVRKITARQMKTRQSNEKIKLWGKTGKALVLATLLLLVAVCLAASAAAWPWSKGTISGIVTDAENASSLMEGVKVTLVETGVAAVTDNYGEFRLEGVSPGSATLSFKKPGFLPKTYKAQVEADKASVVEVSLERMRDKFDASRWTREASLRLRRILAYQGMTKKRIAIAFYMNNGAEQCDLPDMVLRFATEFNKSQAEDGNVVVVRDPKQAGLLMSELKNQHQFKVDFDPATVARIGKKIGADVVIIGALLEKRDYLEPLINGTSVETQAYIPGLSINEILMNKGEAGCN